jgi:signal peptidase II
LPEHKRERKSAWQWLLVSLAIIGLDQWSKYAVLWSFKFNEVKPVFSFLNVTLRYNRGVAFSFLSAAADWHVMLLIFFVLAIAVIILVWLLRLPRRDYLAALGLSLVLGGAMGNVIDRIRFGYVVDFIDFHIKTWHYATFNVADAAVCVGAFCLFLKYIFFSKEKR